MSDEPAQPPARRADDKHPPTNGYPPTEIMQRMLDLQEKRMELDNRQMDINEAEMDQNKELALQSMKYNSVANSERHTAMQRIMLWRYKFWACISAFTLVVVLVALFLGKEAFILEAFKYLVGFLSGYGVKAVVQNKKKKDAADDEE